MSNFTVAVVPGNIIIGIRMVCAPTRPQLFCIRRRKVFAMENADEQGEEKQR